MPRKNKGMMVNIRVEEVPQRRVASPLPPLNSTQDFGDACITPRPIVGINHETWVSRIMHPCVDSDTPAWCPEYWNCVQNQLKSDQGESPDDATIASNSLESTSSSKMNDMSSITPFLPGHATSSDIVDDENHKPSRRYSNETKEERGRGRVTPTSILGIMDRQHLEDHAQDGFAVESVSSRGRTLNRARTPPTPPPSDDGYGWDEDQASSPVTRRLSSPSSRRRQRWETSDAKNKCINIAAEVTKNRPAEDTKRKYVAKEFDLESLTASDAVYYGLGLSGKLAEI
jgi:hypothetical protein